MSTPVDLDPKEYGAILDLLRHIDFFKGVPEENLKGILFSIQKETYAPQKTILFQGEIANRLCIIRQGSVSISTKSKGTKVFLADLKVGAYFGEISLLRPISATATVIAGDEGAQLLILSFETMSRLTQKIPDIQQRIQNVIDERIASKNKAKEKEDNN